MELGCPTVDLSSSPPTLSSSVDREAREEPMKRSPLLALPAELLMQIGNLLDYPSFSMLLCTNRYLRGLWPESLVHKKFLALPLDQHTEDYLDRIRACRSRASRWDFTIYIRRSQAACPDADLSGGHTCFEVRRPGVIIDTLWIRPGGFATRLCELCGASKDIGADREEQKRGFKGWPFRTICGRCWGAGGRRALQVASTSRERRMVFCKRYDDWLRLMWRPGKMYGDDEDDDEVPDFRSHNIQDSSVETSDK